MKKLYRLLITFLCLTGFGAFLILFGFLLSFPSKYASNSENQQITYKYLFLKLTSKPIELMARAENEKETVTKNKPVEKNTVSATNSVLKTTISEQSNETINYIEKTDSIYIMNEKWIKQVIQMNGCFDIYNDFVEKDWMKDHHFIIL
ncbi:MAG: hypothetical protein AB7S50_13470 [Bacteroidales bacterium]